MKGIQEQVLLYNVFIVSMTIIQLIFALAFSVRLYSCSWPNVSSSCMIGISRKTAKQPEMLRPEYKMCVKAVREALFCH